MPDIFLSYAREDLAKAKLLAAALEKQGWTVFWDRSSILTGQDFDDVIEQAIEQSRCMIVSWSNAARRSDWVRGEATIGRERRMLLPVLFEKVDPPIAFRGLHTEDFSAWKGELTAPAFLALCQAIRQHLESDQSEVIDLIRSATPVKKPPVNPARPEPWAHKRRKVIIGLAFLLGALGIGGYWYYSSLSAGQADSKARIKPPEMIPIPAGEFWMGSAEDDELASKDEKPRHKVHVAAFALGKYEVTKAEFAAFAKQTGYNAPDCNLNDSSKNWQNPGFEQSGNDPVTCVSYDDAIAYIRWLNTETGRNFRLPSEAEWEYAARTGKDTSFFWGNDEMSAKEHAWFTGNSGHRTQPVGALGHDNAFDVYDMAGNVWEWAQDCWHDSYKNAPRDGKAWLEQDAGDCARRVLRGGSWDVLPNALRSAARSRFGSVYRNYNIGFRLAQD